MTQALVYPKTGEQHGLINVLANSVPDNDFKHMTPENKAKAEKLKKEESKIVKARYLNARGAHERLSKPYCHWAGQPIQMWHFIPGEVYEVPMGLITEVNKSRETKRSDLLDVNGRPALMDTVEQIHSFVPIGF